MHQHVITITPHEAREAGALDGFDVDCSHCGYVGGSSLRVLAEEHGRGHVAYMAKKEAGR